MDLNILQGCPWCLSGKELPALQETCVHFLGGEGPLEKRMATHSSILAWEIPRTEEPGGLQATGLQRVAHSLATGNTHTRSNALGYTSNP